MKLKLPLPLMAAVMAAFLILPSPAADHVETGKGEITYSEQNSATNGGAIDADNVTLSDNDSVSFGNNSTSVNGGAIYTNTGQIILSGNGDISFSGNSTTGGIGGAIFTRGNVTLSDNSSVSFSGNSAAKNSGGAIYSKGSIALTGNGSISFSENSAGSNNSSGNGGAIATEGDVTLSDNGTVSFANNSARYNGSAIYSYDGQITLTGNKAVSFSDNLSAEGQGGAIFTKGPVTLTGNEAISFSGNEASTGSGGAIYAEGTVTLSDNTGNISFSGNKVSINSGNGKGGAIFSNGQVTLSNNTGNISFANNSSARSSGGAIIGLGGVTLSNNTGIVSFSGNSAAMSSSGNGGAINTEGNVVLSGNGSVSFDNNKVSVNGGAIYANTGQITLSGNGAVSFSGNLATRGLGGAIFTKGQVTLSGNGAVSFSGNSAAGSGGGAIYADGNVTLSNNTGNISFSNNTADKSHGGAIFSKGNVTLSNNSGSVSFSGNSATRISGNGNGGAINAEANVTLSSNGSVSFANNSTTVNGGAIYANTGKVTLTGNGSVFFSGNTSTGRTGGLGGAIYAKSDVTLSGNGIVSCSDNSAAKSNGGVIFSSGKVTLSDNETVSFVNNSSINGHGGTIDAVGHVTLSGNGSIFFSSNLAIEGGAFDTEGDAILTDNRSTVSFSGNSAAKNGGAIFSRSNAILSGNNGIVSFTGNAALDKGGAIRVLKSVSLSDNGSVAFIGNSANVGGAIYAGGDVTLSGNGAVSFENNRGGAIVTEGGNITLSGNGSIRLTGNTIDGSLDESMNAGGAVTMKGGRLLLSADAGDVMFSGNRVTTAAGDVMRAIGLNAGEDAEGNALPASMELQAAAGRTITFHEGIAAGNALLAANMQEGSTGAIVFSGLSASLLERLTGETDEAFAARVQASRTFRLEEAAVGNGTLVVREKALLDANRLALSGSALLDVREDSTVHAGEWNVGDNASFILHSGASLRSDSGTLSLASGVGIDVGSILTGASGKAARFDASNVVLGGTLVLKDAGGQLYTATDAMAQDRKVELAHDVQGSRNGSDFSGLVAEVSEYGYKGTWTAGWEGDTLIGQWTAEQVFQPWDEFRGGAVYNSLWSTASNAQALSGAVRDQSGSPRLLSERKSNVWFSGLGDFGMQRSAGQADGYDYQGGGYALGGDYKLTANHVLGAAFGQMSGRNTSRSYFAHNRQNSLMGAVYGAGLVDMQKHGRLRYNLTAAYGNTSNSIRMYDSLLNRSTTGKWDNTAWELDGRIAWDIALNRTWTASPFIGLEYTAASSDAFTESGENPRHFGKGRLENLSMPVGVSISRSDSVGKGMVWENALSLSYAPDVYRHNPRGTVSMPHTVQGWSTRGVDVGRHAGVFDYTTGLQIDENWRTYAGYTLEIRKDAVLQTARAGVGYSF